jgi:hypothetical protein
MKSLSPSCIKAAAIAFLFCFVLFCSRKTSLCKKTVGEERKTITRRDD